MAEKKIDTLTLELLREALPCICDEMAVVLKRTAYNIVIYEVKDPGDVDSCGRSLEPACDDRTWCTPELTE